MKFVLWFCMIALPSLALAGVPETQEEKDALGAFVIGQMLYVQVALCDEHVPALGKQLDDDLARWRQEKAGLLIRGEASYRKHAPEIAPTLSPDEYLAKLRKAEQDKYFGMDETAFAAGCNGLVSWFVNGPKPAGPAPAASADFVAAHGSFSFSQQVFSGRFLLDSHPMTVEPQPSDRGDHVQFTSTGGTFMFVFEVVSWPTGADAAADLANVEAAAKASTGVQSAQTMSPCDRTLLAKTCLSIQDITYQEKLPIYVRDSVVFQASGWTYSVSAANFGPSTTVRSEADLKDFHPQGSFGNAKMALEAFLGAFRPLPATGPAAH